MSSSGLCGRRRRPVAAEYRQGDGSVGFIDRPVESAPGVEHCGITGFWSVIVVRWSVMLWSKRYFSMSTTARAQARSIVGSVGRGPSVLVM